MKHSIVTWKLHVSHHVSVMRTLGPASPARAHQPNPSCRNFFLGFTAGNVLGPIFRVRFECSFPIDDMYIATFPGCPFFMVFLFHGHIIRTSFVCEIWRGHWCHDQTWGSPILRPSVQRASEFLMVTLNRRIRSTWNLVVLWPGAEELWWTAQLRMKRFPMFPAWLIHHLAVLVHNFIVKIEHDTTQVG